MRILVTGGAGFIGSHIVDALLEDGHSVAVVDDLSTGRTENLSAEARLYKASVTDFDATRSVFAEERPDVVDHHAAQIDVRRSMADPALDAEVNIVGTINLLELSVKYNVTRFIFPSSSTVYSEPKYLPMDESHPTRAQSAYGVSKGTAEAYVEFYGDVHGLRYKVFRYGNVYGPRQNPRGEAGVVAIFTGQLLRGEQPTIFGDGTKTRDYIFVDDIVSANVMAMSGAGDNQVFNLAWGKEVSDQQIFDAVRRGAGLSMSPAYARKRPGEAERVSLDSSKAMRVLGWRPAISLEEGIRRSVAYYRGRSSA